MALNFSIESIIASEEDNNEGKYLIFFISTRSNIIIF